MAKPFAYSTYHIVSCPTQAGTSLALYSFSPAAHHVIPHLLHIILSVHDTTFDGIAYCNLPLDGHCAYAWVVC